MAQCSGTRLPLLTNAILGLLALSAGSLPARAEAAESTEYGGEGGEGSHKNSVGLFVGLTGEGRRDNGFALGLEYERRLTESFGIGGLVERTWGDLDFWVAAIPFAWHTGSWKLFAAPGIEDVDGDSGVNEFLRVGAEYGIEVGRFEIAPQLSYDIVAGENAVVFGVLFGYPF